MAAPQNVSHLTFKFWKVCPVPSLGFLFCTYGYCFAHVFLDWSANTVLEGAMGDGIDGDHLAASEASRAVTDVEQNSLRANSLWPSWQRMYQQIFREDTSAVIV